MHFAGPYSTTLGNFRCFKRSLTVTNGFYMGLIATKLVFGGLRTTKAQTSLHSLISALVIHLLESNISRLATTEISVF